MTFLRLQTRLGFAVAGCMWFSTASATLVLHWEFSPSSQTVGPGDVVTLTATLFNDSASDESIPDSIPSTGIGFTMPSSTAASYDTLGPLPTPRPIGGLAPGRQVAFTFLNLYPLVPDVPEGSYSIFNTSFQFGGDGWQYVLPGPTFTWTVASQAVPEPSSIALLGAALCALAFAMRGRRSRMNTASPAA